MKTYTTTMNMDGRTAELTIRDIKSALPCMPHAVRLEMLHPTGKLYAETPEWAKLRRNEARISHETAIRGFWEEEPKFYS